jgi:hypothetical protein
MLEYERFLIVKQASRTAAAANYKILDAATDRPIGIARIKPNKLVTFLGGLGDSRFLPLKLEAYEIEDEPLVFIVRRNAGFLHGQARIADADDHRLGRFVARGSTAAQGFWILDRQNYLYVTGEFVAERSAHVLRSGEGYVVATLDSKKQETLLEFDSALHDQPLAKMLLLGSAFALDMIFPIENDNRGGS